MNKILLLLTFIFINLLSFGQQGYVYQRNAFGQIDVYQSSYGTPQGQPIATIKMNALGYIEVDNKASKSFSQQESPFGSRPEITTIQPYLQDVATEINSINAYINVYKIQSEEQTKALADEESFKQSMGDWFTEMENQYNYYMEFYNKVLNKPTTLADGWKNCIVVYENPAMSQALDAMNIKSHKWVDVAYCFIKDNKITKYVSERSSFNQYDFSSDQDFVASPITDCKGDINEYGIIKEFYFIDNIIDANATAKLPPFCYYRFQLPENSSDKIATVLIDNVDISKMTQNINPIATLLPTSDGKLTESTTSTAGNYFYKAFLTSGQIYSGSFTLQPGTMGTTVTIQ